MRPARVLLVEDNPVNLMVGQRLLSVLGVNCDTASNGEAALLRMSASRYDVVLMDCQMPVMDGYTATRRWRENEEAADDGRHLAIVAMTANAMAGDRQKCLDAGMDDYLAKPVTRSELERCLHRWWNPRATDAAADHTPVDAPEDAAGHVVAEPAAEPLQALADSVASADSLVIASAAMQAAPAPDAIRGSRDIGMDSSSAAAPAASQRPPQPAVLDLEIVEELRALLGGEVDRLIAVFLEDTPRLIQALENAAVKPDYAGLREAAHSLKSSSANLGAMSLSAAAKRVELGARAESLERPAVAVAVIANEFARARHALLGTTSTRNAAEA